MEDLVRRLDAIGLLTYNILAWVSIIEYKSTNILPKLPLVFDEGIAIYLRVFLDTLRCFMLTYKRLKGEIKYGRY